MRGLATQNIRAYEEGIVFTATWAVEGQEEPQPHVRDRRSRVRCPDPFRLAFTSGLHYSISSSRFWTLVAY